MARKQRIGVSLADIIRAGQLQPGEPLVCEPRRGEVHRGILNKDGSISHEGNTFDSPTAWAIAMARNSRNGWRDVCARGKPLDHFRQNLLRPTQHVPVAERQLRPDVVPPQSGTPAVRPDARPEAVLELELGEQALRWALLNRIRAMKPEAFERLIGRLWESNGFENVRVLGRSHDGNIDGDFGVPMLNVRVMFQAKRYQESDKIGLSLIQQLKGTVVGKYDRGVFVTTSCFTPGAREIAEAEPANLVLVDGPKLAEMLLDRKLGIKAVVERGVVDEGWFQTLER